MTVTIEITLWSNVKYKYNFLCQDCLWGVLSGQVKKSLLVQTLERFLRSLQRKKTNQELLYRSVLPVTQIKGILKNIIAPMQRCVDWPVNLCAILTAVSIWGCLHSYNIFTPRSAKNKNKNNTNKKTWTKIIFECH